MENQDDMIDKIVKALRLVPEFDGNSNILIRFLSLCDQLVARYINPAPGHELANLSLLNGILNKITGNAARTLVTNGVPQDWNGIRNTLIHNFSDHRDESALYNDLSLLSQGSDTPQVFYERVLNLLSTIMTYIEIHDAVATTVEAKRTLYKKLALQTYLRGLAEPLGSKIRCMRPPSLEKALEYAQEEMNVVYLQQKIIPSSKRLLPIFPNVLAQYPQMNRKIPQNFHPNRFIPQQPSPFYQGPSRTQQMFKALPRSNMSTGFRVNPRPSTSQQAPNNQPRPMSGVSHPVARVLPPTNMHDWRNYGNPPPSNYFTTREANVNEFFVQEPDFDYYVPEDLYYCDYDYIPDCVPACDPTTHLTLTPLTQDISVGEPTSTVSPENPKSSNFPKEGPKNAPE